MARVSGVPILGIVRFIKKNLKGKNIEDFLRLIEDKEDREIFQRRIMPTEWYPYRTYINLLTLMDKHFGKGDLSHAHEMGRTAADVDLKGIYKVFLRLGPTNFFLKRIMSMWKGYYDTGKIEVLETGGSKIYIKLSDFNGIKRIHCLTVEGWIERFIELCGVPGVHIRQTQCMAEGSPFCMFEVTIESWEKG